MKTDFGHVAKRFYARLVNRKPLLLPSPKSEADGLRASRVRSEWSREVLSSPVFTEVFQMLNEDVVSQLFETKHDDHELRASLTLKLQLVSELQNKIAFLIDEYESMVLIQEQSRRKQSLDEEAA